MDAAITRRAFLGAGATGAAVLGLGDMAFLSKLPPLSAGEAEPRRQAVRLEPEIEPLVRFLEDTPRERLLEEAAARIRRGLSYREVLAALLLAGVRSVQPRPSVGFKFHAVLVVHSVNEAALSAPDTDRWLPIFWALDYFKQAQTQNIHESGWTMSPVDESAVPGPGKAREALVKAMDAWDESPADAAVAGLARTAGLGEVFELLYRYGARDFRSIGHKAIFIANGQRVLTLIGWRHAEPVLRSMAYALLAHEGDNPAKRDDAADHPWRRNQGLAAQIGAGWQAGNRSKEATVEMLAALRQGSQDDACDKVVQLLRRGAAPQSIWDAVFCGAGELLLRQPGIVALHAVTTSNALHYAYQTSGDDATRRLLLLQNAAFLPMFRGAMTGRGPLRSAPIDGLEPSPPASQGPKAIEELFAELGRDRTAVAGKALAYLQAKGSAKDLMDAGRRLVFLKGNDPHDYKFSVAAMEDFGHVSAPWRDRYLAAAMLQMRGPGGPDTEVTRRVRAALGPGKAH